MRIEDLDACVDLVCVRGSPPGELTLFGGEPLLEPALVRRAVERVRGCPTPRDHAVVRVFTNGVGLDEAMTGWLDRHGVRVTLSCDGVREAQEARSPGTFAIVDALLDRLGREQPDLMAGSLTVRLTLCSGNVAQLAASFAYLLDKGVRDVEVSPVVTPDPGWDVDVEAELDRQLAEVAALSLADRASTGGVAFAAFRGGAAPAVRPSAAVRVCGLGRPDALVVDVDGRIAPCGAMIPSCQPDLPARLQEVVERLAGCRIRDPDLERGLEERRRRASELPLVVGKERMRSARHACADCRWLGTCFVCAASVAYGERGLDRIPEHQCAWNRLLLEHREAFRGRAGAV